MTKQASNPPPSETAAAPDEPDQNGVAGTPGKGAYNPSFETRFQLGQSGNPSGRPKGSRNKSKIVEQILNETITVRDGGRSRKMSRFEVMVKQMANDAAKGDHKAWASMLLLIRTFNLIDKLPEPELRTSLTANDDDLWADITSRAREGHAKPKEVQKMGIGQ